MAGKLEPDVVHVGDRYGFQPFLHFSPVAELLQEAKQFLEAAEPACVMAL